MGVDIGGLVHAKQVRLVDLAGKTIGIDGHNVSYQFLTRIRETRTGEPLRDRRGRVTSHLSGLLYRTSKLIEVGIRPIFVWDGQPPKLKERTVKARMARRKKAEIRWVEALDRGEEAMVYAQAASKLTPQMVEESIRLLGYMGVPSVQAPSEGEAQLAVMGRKNDIWAGASQDWDCLLFNSPRLIRNLSLEGRRKLPRKNIYVQTKPELVQLDEVLERLSITREQLILIGLLIGTDYNPGIKGIGPKTALRLVKEHQTIDHVLANVEWKATVDAEVIFNFFLDPPASEDYEITWNEPDIEGLIEFMVEEHDFSLSRVEKVGKILGRNLLRTKEKSLRDFF
jgi:flap endonuclease-1